MITSEYVREMAVFHCWQNDVVYGLCDEIGAQERGRDRGMFFGSIHNTLDHICMVNRAILIYMDSGVPPDGGYEDVVWPDWEDLKKVRVEQDASLAAAADSWSEAWMAETIVMNSPRFAAKPTIPRWIMISQLFNHQTHHRSQVTAELHKMGLDYGSTDMPFRPGAGYFGD